MQHAISPQPLTPEKISQLLGPETKLILSEVARQRIETCRTYLDQKLAHANRLFYGINTGFGSLRNQAVPKDQLAQLQNNLVVSHACGTGPEVPADIVRIMLLLKIHSLAMGYSGVSLSTVQRLIDFFNNQVHPVVYQQGSLGASGDLAPLAHLSLPLIGKGEVYWNGQRQPTASVLNALGWTPLQLQSKEGLALLNGTQFMSAYGTYVLGEAERLCLQANLIACLSLDAFDGSAEPFQLPIHHLRPYQGQIATAAFVVQTLADSAIFQQPKIDVQDPYSFRCIPQVHGACIDSVSHFKNILTTEINSVTDNPLIFAEHDRILSGGNFHGQPLAMAFDALSIALAELGSISERRIFLLLSGQRQLPPYLVVQPGLHSGLMIAQYTAAALVNENKVLCMPASVDSIPTSNGQEDHVSMGAFAGVKCLRICENTEKILAIELMVAAQALDCRRPLRSSTLIERLHALYRTEVPFLDHDRELYADIQRSIDFLRTLRHKEIEKIA